MLSDPRARLIEGPVGPLEVLFQPAEEVEVDLFAAVVAHPHPLHGGTMMNKVVFRACRALRRAGVATLRFNFRGVGRSAGEHDGGIGEVDDLRAALDELERLRPGHRLLLGGYSFGSRIALKVAESDARVEAVIGLGLPLSIYPDMEQLLADFSRPLLIVQGTTDELTSAAELRTAVAGLPRPPTIFDAQAGHDFFGGLDLLDEVLPWFVGRLENPTDSADDRDPRLA